MPEESNQGAEKETQEKIRIAEGHLQNFLKSLEGASLTNSDLEALISGDDKFVDVFFTQKTDTDTVLTRPGRIRVGIQVVLQDDAPRPKIDLKFQSGTWARCDA